MFFLKKTSNLKFFFKKNKTKTSSAFTTRHDVHSSLFHVAFCFKGSGGWEHIYLCIFPFRFGLSACAAPVLNRRDILHSVLHYSWVSLRDHFPGHFPVAAVWGLHLLFCYFWCGCCHWMPPTAADLRLFTITELLQLLVSVAFELCKRFRITLPEVPEPDPALPFHCLEQCEWCTCACARTSTTHHRHQCRRHLGF